MSVRDVEKYIYIYIEREREREKFRVSGLEKEGDSRLGLVF